jgi:hypothetical protein
MDRKNVPWVVIGVGAAIASVVYWYARSASGAAPASAMSLGPSGLLPGFHPSTGPGIGPITPTPATPIPSSSSSLSPASGIAPSSITKIEQAEAVIFNQSRQEWMMPVNVYQGLNATYKLVFSPAKQNPTGASWTTGLAKLFGVSPSIIQVNG